MSDGIPLADLVVGRKYRVEMDDCCVQGWFAGTLQEVVLNEGDPYELLFDTGRIGPKWGKWTITETVQIADTEDHTALAAHLATQEAAQPIPWESGAELPSTRCSRCNGDDVADLGGWYECRACGKGWPVTA